MNKSFSLYILVFLLLNQIISTAQTNEQSKEQRETYAVVVGIAQYENKNIPRLQYSDRDAVIFSEYLQSKAGGSVPDHHIKLLVNAEASIAAVYDALSWLAEVAKPGDLIYFYFSGHGDTETKDTFNLGYLLAYNSPPNNYNNNAITIEDLNNLANRLTIENKARVVLITDACHSGKLAGDFYKGKQLVAGQLRSVLNNEVRLTACNTNEEAAEGVFWGGGRGAFSYYLLSGLTGFAEQQSDGIIRIKEMQVYLDSVFKADTELKHTGRKQNPVVDGNPYFSLSKVDASILATLKSNSSKANTGAVSIQMPGLKPLGRQPIDYLFSLVETAMVDTALPFSNYLQDKPDSIPTHMLSDYLKYLAEQENKYRRYVVKDDKDQNTIDRLGNTFLTIASDSLNILLEQLTNIKSMRKRFNERYVQSVHTKAQDMVNAYLAGDIAELERRQYYFNGTRSYDSFLVQMKLALHLIPKDHYLEKVMNIQYSYLSGLCDRLKMVTGNNIKVLLTSALKHQNEAQRYDAYAAYIQNELGNLFLYSKQYDSAFYHFKVAAKLAPTWAVPWSNLIRLNLGLRKINEAKEAIHIADSLQPDLAYVNVNAGLVMEQDSNWLAAESYYLRAIAKNEVHYLPYERLGKVYIATGEYSLANYYLYQAGLRKEKFKVNESSFEFGIELGGQPYFGDRLHDSIMVVLERLYHQASKYEKEKLWSKAIKVYSAVSDLENAIQSDQAEFKGLINPGTLHPDNPDFRQDFNDPYVLAKYERPVPQGGAIIASRLLVQQGDYTAAESILLNQITKNRHAGFQRQKVLDSGFTGPGQQGGAIPPFNYYWLNINVALESETYIFYKQMLERYPRESDWYRKAGLFLYDRLALSFGRIPVENQLAFYDFLLGNAYPFLGGEQPHEAYDISFSLPGTGEQISIHVPEYDPLQDALNFLQQGSKLSGNKTEEPKVIEAIGDLNGWMGNEEESVKYYQHLLQRLPQNDTVRYKLSERLRYNDLYPAAIIQMEILAAHQQLSKQQIYQLASYQMHTRNYTKATSAIAGFIPANKNQADSLIIFRAKLSMMMGNNEMTLRYVRDSLKPVLVNELMPDDELGRYSDQNYFRLYSIARIYAIQHEQKKATIALKSALEQGLWYRSLLLHDEAFKDLRKQEQWKTVMSQYSAEREEEHFQSVKYSDSPLKYCIPVSR